MYDYFTHAENPEKSPYDIKDIECGCGFNLAQFLVQQNSDDFITEVIDTIEQNDITEFEELVWYARDNDTALLGLIIERTYFSLAIWTPVGITLSDYKKQSKNKEQILMETIKLNRIEELLNTIITIIQKELQTQNSYGIITQKELLKLLQISPNTLKSWENKGLKRLEPPIEGTRTVYYKMEDVIEFLTI